MAALALTVALTLHPAGFTADWTQRTHDEGLTRPLLDEWKQARTVAPCEIGGRCHGAARWTPLIRRYFPASQVGKAVRVLRCESQGNPKARNPHSSAAGLWQFLRSTWNRAARRLGLPSYAQGGPFDPVAATRAAAWLWARGSHWHQWSCG